MRTLPLLMVALGLLGCASNQETGRPGPAEQIIIQLARDSVRATTREAQRAIPETGYWPVDRAVRTATTGARRGGEDFVFDEERR